MCVCVCVCVCSVAYVEKAAEALAVDTLLISDVLFRYRLLHGSTNSNASLCSHKSPPLSATLLVQDLPIMLRINGTET